MIFSKLRILFTAPLLVLSLSSHAADIAVHHAYLNAPPPVAKVTAGYFVLHNNTPSELTVERFTSPVADNVELHKTSHENGQMKMRKMKTLTIGSNSTAELRPGGMHLMFMKLNKTLSPGDNVPIVLHFTNGTQFSISANVRDLRNAPGAENHDQHRH